MDGHILRFMHSANNVVLRALVWHNSEPQHGRDSHGILYSTCANTSITTVFTIMTAAFGVPTIVNFSRRMYYLLKRDPICRPIGSKRGWVSGWLIINS
jgi:hypothetical protein